jgi:hypothetical protein
MKKIFATFLVSCILATSQTGCIGKLWPKTQPVVDQIWAIDSSTPSQYSAHHGGFLGFIDNKGLITQGLRTKYNALISLYKDQFFEAKAVKLNRDVGLEKYTDEHGNKLYLIDEEHLVYFIILKNWNNELRPPDK